jgi:hypothetical protein
MPKHVKDGEHVAVPYNDLWDEVAAVYSAYEIASMIAEALGIEDEEVVRGDCVHVSMRIMAYLVAQLRPDLLRTPAQGLARLYRDDLLSVGARREVQAQLADLIACDAGSLRVKELLHEAARSLAVVLVNTALSEIGHEVLDAPVVYAPAISRALDHVAASLRKLAQAKLEWDEATCAQAAASALYLIVREVCPHYLLVEEGDTPDSTPHGSTPEWGPFEGVVFARKCNGRDAQALRVQDGQFILWQTMRPSGLCTFLREHGYRRIVPWHPGLADDALSGLYVCLLD